MKDALRFTGERPGRGPGFDYDVARHLAAYAFARNIASGKRVLDAGCGDGFGAHSLVDVATEVVGIDASPQAIAACQRRWPDGDLHFLVGDLTQPVLAGQTFDVVLNFQVLEHLPDPIPFLHHLRALVRADGVLVLTTPNRLTSFSENPFHVHEYTAAELTDLLASVFSSVGVSGLHGSEKVAAFDLQRKRNVQRILRLDPLGLRKVLPRPVVEFAFARLAMFVRRQTLGSRSDSIVPEDFSVRGGTETALDLLAMCQP